MNCNTTAITSLSPWGAQSALVRKGTLEVTPQALQKSMKGEMKTLEQTRHNSTLFLKKLVEYHTFLKSS